VGKWVKEQTGYEEDRRLSKGKIRKKGNWCRSLGKKHAQTAEVAVKRGIIP